MDYKYIEQLLERYWQCETSIEEEKILRTFFSQKEVPAMLLKYRDLFVYEQRAKTEKHLGDDFDARIMALIGKETPVKARTITLRNRFMPLFKAAAIVAIIVTLGNAAQLSTSREQTDEEINYSDYKDTYKDPATAYDKVHNALELVSEGFNMANVADTVPTQGITDEISNKE